MSLRAVREKARRALHTAMRVPAHVYEPGETIPRRLYVRVHRKWLEQGDLKGTNFNYAEVEEKNPRVVFMREDIANPTRNTLVIVAADEGYRLGQTEPPDGITITAEAVPMTAREFEGREPPEGD